MAIRLPAGHELAGCEGDMAANKDKVIYLSLRDPQEALERLNRVTGLRFSSWPQSLVSLNTAAEHPSDARNLHHHDAIGTTKPSARVIC